MPDPGPDFTGSRRRFLRTAAGWLCATPFAGIWIACASKNGAAGDAFDGKDAFDATPLADPSAEAETAAEATDTAEAEAAGPTRTLSPERFAVLAGMFDALIPGDDLSPGAALAGAADYLDALLGALSVDPPRIFAGGPYSGRHSGLDGFSSFVPLTRVETIAWTLRLQGSQGRKELEFNGPVKGLRQVYEEGLDALDAAARAANGGTGYAALGPDDRRASLMNADPDFLQTAFEHAVEGMLSDPVYGGNKDGIGWKTIQYEGDRVPLGYSARQMSNPEEG